jgi:hypothetical protein
MAKTFIVHSRHKIEDIATIAAHLNLHGIKIRNKSDPITIAVSTFAHSIRVNSPSFNFDLHEAYDVLTAFGIEPETSKEGMLEIYKQMQSSVLKDMPEEIVCDSNDTSPIRSTESQSDRERRRKEEIDKQIEAFKNISGLEIEE